MPNFFSSNRITSKLKQTNYNSTIILPWRSGRRRGHVPWRNNSWFRPFWVVNTIIILLRRQQWRSSLVSLSLISRNCFGVLWASCWSCSSSTRNSSHHHHTKCLYKCSRRRIHSAAQIRRSECRGRKRINDQKSWITRTRRQSGDALAVCVVVGVAGGRA